MNTWQMLKELTENKNKVFKSDNEDGDIVIICYIREGGAYEFKLFEYGKYVTDNIILYPEDKWIEISNDEMEMFLFGCVKNTRGFSHERFKWRQKWTFMNLGDF